MKKRLLTLIIILTESILVGGKPDTNKVERNNGSFRETALVNASDTVVFDLSQAVISGSYIDIPVSILSDDTVYALDFSLKYDQANLIYDSMINHTNYVQAFSFYNTMDSTLRFTSNSFQRYTNDTSLVSIHFNILSGQISDSDFYDIHAYLNGDSCSVKVTNVLFTGVPGIIGNNLVKVYPNPTSGTLNVEVSEKAIIQLVDINGRPVLPDVNVNENQKQEINAEIVTDGMYVLKIYTEHFAVMKKVVIVR